MTKNSKEKFIEESKTKRNDEGIDEEKVVDNIDLLVNLIKVRSGLGGTVTEDYVLGSFGEAERDFIRENFENAEYAKNIIMKYANKGYQYEWDNEKRDWKRDEDFKPMKVMIKEEDRKTLTRLANNLFLFFMMQSHLIAILHRNKKENFMVNLLGKGEEEKEEVVGQMDAQSLVDRMKKELGKKKDGE